MSPKKWRSFMARWSSELMASELAASVVPAPPAPDWLGFGPARKRELKELEDRLGMILPPSYRSFLQMSDGWRRTTFAIGRLRPAAEVDWFRSENESWIQAYSESGSDLSEEAYYTYPDGSASDHRVEHLASLVQISDVEDGVYLLNPEAVTPDGEWEAWFFANWVPGVIRYPSFAQMMKNEYLSFAQLQGVQVQARSPPKLVIPGPEVSRIPADRLSSGLDESATLDELIAQMGQREGKRLNQVVRRFVGKLVGRGAARRRPDLIPALVDLFHASSLVDVRVACLSAITELAVEPPPLLLEALSDPDPWVVHCGISALLEFPNPAALEPLCRFIDSGPYDFFRHEAISALGKLEDERAVPTLARVLLNVTNRLDQSFGYASMGLSRCGPGGFAVLVSALDHTDPRIRRAAVLGVDLSGEPSSVALLDRMETDPDPAVRERARIRMGKPRTTW